MNFTWWINEAIVEDRFSELVEVIRRWYPNDVVMNCADVKNENLPMSGYVIPLSTIKNVRTIRRNFNAITFWDENDYNVLQWLQHFPDLNCMLNSDGFVVPLRQLQNSKIINMLKILPHDKWFIRPNSSFKLFTGFDDTVDGLFKEVKLLKQMHNYDSELVLVAPYKKLQPIEYRFWVNVSKQQIVAYSPYSWTEDAPWHAAPKHVTKFIARVIKHLHVVFIDEVVVIDVGVLDDTKECKVIEFNAASTSGIYNVPLEEYVKGIREAAVIRATEIE